MSTAASPLPGERVSSYDITGRQDSDYYPVSYTHLTLPTSDLV